MPRTPNGRSRAEVHEAVAQVAYGCTYAEVLALNGGQPHRARGTLADAYATQRKNALRRGVAWEITFPEWVAIWQESGRLAQRGRVESSYCMGRHGDTGPYKVGNVSIIPFSVNRHAGTARGGLRRLGTGKGWLYRPDLPHNPYIAVVGTRYIGAFPTPEEATAARDEAVARMKEAT